jgi:hypothetical protein
MALAHHAPTTGHAPQLPHRPCPGPSDPRPTPTPPGVIKDVFIEDLQGTTALDDPVFTDCLGYQGQLYEDRHGVYKLTIHTRASMPGVTHVEGDVTATFAISPIQGTGTVHRGTYREHATGSFLIINGEDVPHPATSFYLHGTGTGSDGSQICFTIRGHLVLDKRTGQVRRNAIISTCRFS